MKIIRRILITLAVLIGIGWALLFLLPDDTVTSRYATIAEARADELFGRGWLPDLLPPSSRDIRTSNDLDLNISEGEFSFEPDEYAQFAASLRPSASLDQGSFSASQKLLSKRREEGLDVKTHTEEGITWVFYCKSEDGYCKYYMWLHRG